MELSLIYSRLLPELLRLRRAPDALEENQHQHICMCADSILYAISTSHPFNVLVDQFASRSTVLHNSISCIKCQYCVIKECI